MGINRHAQGGSSLFLENLAVLVELSTRFSRSGRICFNVASLANVRNESAFSQQNLLSVVYECIMGRAEPSIGRPPASFRKDVRAKKAKATINKVIPSLLMAHPRSRRGIEASELIVEPPVCRASKNDTVQTAGPRVTLRVTDTLTAAHLLLENAETGQVDLGNTHARVGILNMASPLSPGGGFVNGATSQEESLCMRTTLLPSLKDEFYRLPEVGVVFTPDVLVFRDEEGEDLEKRGRWFVDSISAAMLRHPETEVDEGSGRGRYVNEKDRELVLQKMRVVMRVCQMKGIRKLVLGAWGCGAYGNPIGEVAKAWRKVLLGGKNGKSNKKGNKETWYGIEEVVFAIKDEGLSYGFEKAFGDGLVREETDIDDLDEEQDDIEEARMRELQEKIQEMELRFDQAKSPQLQSGLNAVLQGLKSQVTQQAASDDRDVASVEDEEDGENEEEDEGEGEKTGECSDDSEDRSEDTENTSEMGQEKTR